MAYLQVETTTDSAAEATKIARAVIEARAAACAQVLGPITSTYRWEGEVVTDEEFLVRMKTSSACYTDLEQCVLEVHGYEVPEIIATPVTHGHQEYLDWIDEETGSAV